ncbi:eukaryotic translation initiation factor 3 subunit D-like [Olea europaea subsp. europaea]|uniref:Eukaryotic translation initiation factor 3 subunit D-like n=1 Tax=Olea europaea subsp. europaea TaxID=158383 RepID=A0A8S0V426_OLEEU|nr:eukaryotic translation initiation factor 3 subunit D-like [Olea europaea subsp. europaea]
MVRYGLYDGPDLDALDPRSQLPQCRDEEVEAKKREVEKDRAHRVCLYHLNRSQIPQGRESVVFKSSVDIQPEWNILDHIPFSTFSKLSFSVPVPEDLLICRGQEFYDRAYDRITSKNCQPLERFKNETSSNSPPLMTLSFVDWLMRIKLLFLQLMLSYRP